MNRYLIALSITFIFRLIPESDIPNFLFCHLNPDILANCFKDKVLFPTTWHLSYYRINAKIKTHFNNIDAFSGMKTHDFTYYCKK